MEKSEYQRRVEMVLRQTPTEGLKIMATMVKYDSREGADFAMDRILEVLEERISTEEFTAFCETL